MVTRGDEQAARDALQETYLRVVRHGKRFDDEEAFWSWLTVLARCAARDGGRRQQRYRHLISRYFQFRNTDSIHEAEPTSKDPEQVLEDRVHDSLARMDPSERSLLESKYFERASVRDLARQLSLSEKAVESKMTRARKKLKSMVLNQMRQPNET